MGCAGGAIECGYEKGAKMNIGFTEALTARQHTLGCVLVMPVLWYVLSDEQRKYLLSPTGCRSTSLVVAAIKEMWERGWDDVHPSANDAAAIEAIRCLKDRVYDECDYRPIRVAAHFRECMKRLDCDFSISKGERTAEVSVEALEAHINNIRKRVVP